METILAISPSGQSFGIAVITDGKLLFYGTKSITHRSSKQEILEQIEKIMTQLILDYDVSVLAIKHIKVTSSKADLIATITGQIKALAQRLSVITYEYSSKEIRQIMCKDSKATNRQLINHLTIDYGELVKHTSQHKKDDWKTKYYGKLFFAIALGLVCSMKPQKQS